MDPDTLGRWRNLAVSGTGGNPDIPPHLNELEQQAFLRCRDENLRLEQERIPQDEVVKEAKYLLDFSEAEKYVDNTVSREGKVVADEIGAMLWKEIGNLEGNKS